MSIVERRARMFWYAGPAFDAHEIAQVATDWSDPRFGIAQMFIYRWSKYRENGRNSLALASAINLYYAWDSKRKMIAFPGLLISPAKAAKINVPDNETELNDLVFDRKAFPHFTVYVNFQLGRKIVDGISHWRNAVAIAKIPDDQIELVTEDELFDKWGCV